MIVEEEIPDKSQVEREHLGRVKEHMLSEEEALKEVRTIKGVDKKKYKKFKNVKYVPPPKKELSDEMKLKLTRRYQALSVLIGFVGLGVSFFIIYNPMLHLSVLENFVIVLKFYNSTLYLSIFENYLIIETNLILLGCALAATSVMEIINFQHKHDKISDRISAGQSTRIRTKKARHIYRILIMFMLVAGAGIVFLNIYDSTLHLSIFENFVISFSIHDSMLHLSILKSIVIKMNLILLGGALAATSVGIIATH